MHELLSFLQHTLDVALEAAPWLLFGLIAAGLFKAFVPDQLLLKWIGHGTIGPVSRAALIGTPLPLCSCGVIPAAVGLRRQGASPGATVAFLIATPETGADSFAISYAMLGPFLMVVRPIAAVISAIVSGLACQLVAWRRPAPVPAIAGQPAAQPEATCGCASEKSASQQDNCCGTLTGKDDDCCATDTADGCKDDCCSSDPAPSGGLARRALGGLRYAATDLTDDLAGWLLVGLILAGLVATFISPSALAQYGSGISAMLLMVLIGIPMYICATASTPLAAAFLLAGVSPGTVLVFLLAGPATNIATIGLIRRELGGAVVLTYLAGITGCAIGLGLVTDWLVRSWHLDIAAQLTTAHGILPTPIAALSLAVLLICAIKPLRRLIIH